MESGCLLWGILVIIPSELRTRLLQELHKEHLGIARMKSLARSHMWWPKMDDAIAEEVKACRACHEAKGNPPKALLHPCSWPTRPWQRIHVYFSGPFQGRTFLLVIDAHSKWGEVIEMKSTTAVKTISVLRNLFAAYLAHQLVSDNGPQFVSQEFAMFMKNNGVKHTRCAPYHPSSNGEAERFVRTFKEALKASKYCDLPFPHCLENILLTHSATRETPSKLFLGRQLRTRLDLLDCESQVLARQQVQKDRHDRHARDRVFDIDRKVMVRKMCPGPAWISGVIIQKLGPTSYLVDVHGNKPWKCHVDQLKELLGSLDVALREVPPQIGPIEQLEEVVLDDPGLKQHMSEQHETSTAESNSDTAGIESQEPCPPPVTDSAQPHCDPQVRLEQKFEPASK